VEAMRAIQCLSEADKFVQRANETQNYSWWKYAGSIAEEVANVRITEPYDWINKSYPNARRNKPPQSSYDNSTATLYRELKEYEGHVGSFSFHEFRRDVLPVLKECDKEERMEMVLTYSLSAKAMKALDVTNSQYENWLTEEDREVEETIQTEIGDSSPDNDENKGILDF